MANKDKSKNKKSKPAKVAEVDDDEEELEELEDDEATDSAPKKAGSDEVTFGASDLAKLLSKKTDKKISPRDLRTLLRKMARDGRIDRTITPGNRTRYDWSGPDDPEVKKIIKAVTSGELEEGKREALNKLKEQKAAKQAEKAKAAKKKEKAAKAAAADDDDDDDDE